jgi:hypothetical protein
MLSLAISFRREMMAAFQLARRRLLVEQHAVHAEAHAKLFLERLDVDVAGAVLDGLPDHGVDQPDDGRLAGHVAQMLEVFVGLRGADFGVEGLLGRSRRSACRWRR